MSGEGALPYVFPLESIRLRSLPGFADPPKGRVISSSLNGIAFSQGDLSLGDFYKNVIALNFDFVRPGILSRWHT